MAEIAGLSEQSVRNYTRWYADLLTPAARGETGQRLFSDEDIQMVCTIASLRRRDVPQAEIIERLRRGDIYVDHNTPQQEPTTTTRPTGTALESTQALMLVRFDLQRQIDALQRSQAILLRAALLWGVVLGAIGALAVGAFVLWLLWLLAGMQ